MSIRCWFSPRNVAAALIWAMITITSLWLFFFVTPVLEARFLPVITDQKVEVNPEDRSPGQICWTWSWVKTRQATPVVVAWTIHVSGTAVEYQAVTRRQRDNRVMRDPQPIPPGKGENDLCAIIPTTIDKEPDLTIRGVISYIPPHRLWQLWYDLPPVRVPPLRQSVEGK